MSFDFKQKFDSYADAHNEFLAAIDTEITELTRRQADIKRGVARLLGTKPKRARAEPVLDEVPPPPAKLKRETTKDYHVPMNLEHYMRESESD